MNATARRRPFTIGEIGSFSKCNSKMIQDYSMWATDAIIRTATNATRTAIIIISSLLEETSTSLIAAHQFK
jgi:hypothetical protein